MPWWADALGVSALALLTGRWFAGWPAMLPTFVPAGMVLVFGAWRLSRARPRSPARPALSTLLCLALALLYRLPALLHPWGWVNRDGAYGGFVALHLLQGLRPAPAFTEGANYQGTLKGHLAALLSLATGVSDLSWLMVAAGVLLSLVFIASTMALARRLAGEPAAWASGLFLALGPRFPTVLSLNSVGQYIEVLALGGLALALCARLLDGPPEPSERTSHFVLGWLLGTAFWQQPVALSYLITIAIALALRRASWRGVGLPVFATGLGLGALPVLLWNLQNAWASGDILGREPSELRAQIDALPHLARRALTISFPILTGMSPAHPWGEVTPLRLLATALIPLALLGYLIVKRRALLAGLRRGEPSPAVLTPLLTVACLAIFWAVASGRVYWRPRYLLPLLAPLAVHLGVVVATAGRRTRPLAVATVSVAVAINVAGMWPRLQASREIGEPYRRLVRVLEEKGIRTGYADFSLSAPVTLFTAERIVLSPALGPTPAYESELHARRVRDQGPDAYVLLASDDPRLFAAILDGLGVTYRLDLDPVPIFHALSRRVALEEVAGFRAGSGAEDAPPE